MKKLILFLVLFGAITLNAQTVDTLNNISSVSGNTVLNNYTLRGDNIFAASLYYEKAGNNLMWGGITAGMAICSSIVPLILDNPSSNVMYACFGVSGCLGIVSIIEMSIAANNMKKGSIILRKKGTYTIELKGSSIEIKF